MFFIQQANDHDCGITCLKILLANIHHDSNYLFLKSPFKEEASFLDLIEFASTSNVELVALRAVEKNEIVNYEQFPFIARVNINNMSHALYVYKKSKKYIYYFDPARGEERVSIEEFTSMWTGEFLNVKEFRKTPCPVSKPKLMSNKEVIISLIFSLISIISAALAIYFINKDAYIFVPIILFSVMLISEVVQKKYSIIVTRHIDKRMEEMIGEVKDKDYYTFYRNYEMYKKYLLVNNLTIISSLAVFLLLSLIFIINDKMNIIYILVNLLFAATYALLIRPKLNKEEMNIALIESSLKKKNDKLEAFSSMNEARELSYKYVNKVYAYKYVVIAFEVILTFILMIYHHLVNVTYIICYVVLQFYLYSNLVSLLTINEDINEQDNLLNKIINNIENK